MWRPPWLRITFNGASFFVHLKFNSSRQLLCKKICAQIKNPLCLVKISMAESFCRSHSQQLKFNFFIQSPSLWLTLTKNHAFAHLIYQRYIMKFFYIFFPWKLFGWHHCSVHFFFYASRGGPRYTFP